MARRNEARRVRTEHARPTLFGLGKYQMRFSTSSPEGLGKKYVNEPELWKQTEDMVRRVLVESGINFVEVANEAAFYGPKIDVQVWSAIGREFTIATNQVDFAVPAKFGLTYRDRDNTDKTPLCIHRAPLGTHERFIGFLIEHYAGNFPLWLAWEQVAIIPVRETALGYAKDVAKRLRARDLRVHLDEHVIDMRTRIKEAQQRKASYTLVVGDKEAAAGTLSVRRRGSRDEERGVTVDAFLERLIQERASKALPPDFTGHRGPSAADAMA